MGWVLDLCVGCVRTKCTKHTNKLQTCKPLVEARQIPFTTVLLNLSWSFLSLWISKTFKITIAFEVVKLNYFTLLMSWYVRRVLQMLNLELSGFFSSSNLSEVLVHVNSNVCYYFALPVFSVLFLPTLTHQVFILLEFMPSFWSCKISEELCLSLLCLLKCICVF